MHILIIEDNAAARSGLVALLTDRGHTTCWASSGEDGLALMRTERPQLVILDILLGPGMTGWDVAREMMIDERIRPIPLIIVSALSTSEVLAGGQAVSNALAGARFILGKPVDVEVLEHVIAALALP